MPKNSCVDCGNPCHPTAQRCRGCAQKLHAERFRNFTAEQYDKASVSNARRGERQREEQWTKAFREGSPDECWPWEGTLFKGSGYGRWGQRRAHVESWERANGRKVPGGLIVCHTCDNPPCVNPGHLYVGTHADNARDRKLRDRGSKGTKVNTNKLTEEQVYAIRRACDAGEKQRSVAEQFGITQPMVGFIARRKSWAWLPEEIGARP